MIDTDENHQDVTDVRHVALSRTKYMAVAVAVVLAFFAAYALASGRSGSAAQASTAGVSVEGNGGVAACDPAVDPAVCGGDCCGSGPSVPIEGSAAVEGDLQLIHVDVSAGYFDPNVIRVTAGIPIELTFSEGSGCMSEVMFKDFAVFESLTDGGAVIELPALEPGEYEFSCGMGMVFGTLAVE